MAEFKGTKGELELKYVSGVCIGIGTVGDYAQITANTILPDTDEDYEIEEEEIVANMKLYAASPQILEALIEILPIAEEFINKNHPTHKKAIESIKKALE